MIANLFLLLLLAAQPAPDPVTVTPTQFAGALQGLIGQTYEGGVTIAHISAEGQTLVIVLDGPAGWRTAMTPVQTSNIFIGSFCQDRDFEYFVHGNVMRIDTTEGGAGVRAGPIVRACPPPAQAARPQ